MKTICIAGNIGKDAVTRSTGSGKKVTGWSVAVEDRSGTEKRTIWFDCALWGERGESLAQYLTKGTRVAVSGDLSFREYEGKTILTVRADQVTLLGGGEKRDDQSERQPDNRAPAGGRNAMDDDSDPIPF